MMCFLGFGCIASKTMHGTPDTDLRMSTFLGTACMHMNNVYMNEGQNVRGSLCTSFQQFRHCTINQL